MNNKRNLHITFDDHLGSVMEDQMMDEIRWFIDLEKGEMVGLSTEAINEYYEMEEDEWKALEAKDEEELDEIESGMLKYDENFADISIVMVTSRARQSDRDTGYHTGADLYITKPFKPEEVVAAVKKLTGAKAAAE